MSRRLGADAHAEAGGPGAGGPAGRHLPGRRLGAAALSRAGRALRGTTRTGRTSSSSTSTSTATTAAESEPATRPAGPRWCCGASRTWPGSGRSAKSRHPGGPGGSRRPAGEARLSLAGIRDRGRTPGPVHDLGVRIHRAPGASAIACAPRHSRPDPPAGAHGARHGEHRDRAHLLPLGQAVGCALQSRDDPHVLPAGAGASAGCGRLCRRPVPRRGAGRARREPGAGRAHRRSRHPIRRDAPGTHRRPGRLRRGGGDHVRAHERDPAGLESPDSRRISPASAPAPW